MIVLNINGVSVSFAERKVLDNISLSVQDGEKIGIIGVNGAGKTTLLKVILGQYHADEGSVYIAKDFPAGYLEQGYDSDSKTTIYDAVLESYKHIIQMEKEIAELELLASVEKDKEKLAQILKKYSIVSERFRSSGQFEYISRAKGILKGLGFTEDEFTLPVTSLSGGQRTRLMMARLLANEPGILILDEPTNHLDVKALSWLEGFIKDYKKTVIIVSHDRYFLDKVCGGIFEIEHGKGKYYKGNYTTFVAAKKLDRDVQQKKYNDQQKEIERLEAFVEQQRRWNRERNIIAAESRIKAIDRMEKVDNVKKLPDKIELKITSETASVKDVVSVNNLRVKYGSKLVLSDISFEVKRGERVFILGPNGCGKSTLLKAIISKVAAEAGKITIGHKVNLAYYDQELSELDGEKTVYDEILDMEQKLSQFEIRNTLASFLFKSDDVFKKISVLSGGEKSRVIFTKLILTKPNLLIMDEPTNHLDINTREVLEDALSDYNGTIICVSHDRYFIKKLATRVLEFNGFELSDFKGNYEDYIEHKKTLPPDEDQAKTKKVSATKDAYLLQKAEKAEERKREKKITDTEERIASLEQTLDEITTEIESPEVASNYIKLTELFNKKAEIEELLDGSYKLWEELIGGGS